MPEEKLKRLAKDLKAGRLSPVYLLEGEDYYRKVRGLDAIVRAAVGDEPAADAVERVEGAPAAELCEKARTPPFFASRRVIVATGFEKFGDAELDALAAYARDPSDSAVLVFWTEGKLDRRRKLYKFFEGGGAAYTFQHLKGPARRARLAAEAARLGLKLTDEALSYLDFAMAPDLAAVVNELEKLAAYAAGEELDMAAAAAVAAVGRADSAYDMVRFVAEGKTGAALAAIRQLVLSGERPESLVGLLARQLRLIWLAKGMSEEGLSRAETASRLGIAPFFVGEYADAAARLSFDRLAELHRMLAALDIGLKRGRVPPALALELFAAGAAT